MEESGNGIGWAVEQLTRSKRVRRAGWNGKGMWLVLLRPGYPDSSHEYPLQAHYYLSGRDVYSMEPCVAMKTAGGLLQPGWVCSQADLLARDWEIVQENEP